MTTDTVAYVCPKCGTQKEGSKAPLCVKCDYTVMVPVDQYRPQLSLEKVLALGMIASLPSDQRDRINECIKNLHAVVAKVPKDEQVVAFMVFSAEFMEKL